jgi:hypothetical protein
LPGVNKPGSDPPLNPKKKKKKKKKTTKMLDIIVFILGVSDSPKFSQTSTAPKTNENSSLV